jgi:hypothetical protein
MHRVGCLGQGKGFCASLPLFAGIGCRLDGNRVLLKEPLSFLATGSALAMVQPIDVRGHGLTSFPVFTDLERSLSSSSRIMGFIVSRADRERETINQ